MQVMVVFGRGFHGVKQIAFTSADRATIRGTIDGRPIVPFPIKADPKSITFADGTAIPATRIDDETKRALPSAPKSDTTDSPLLKRAHCYLRLKEGHPSRLTFIPDENDVSHLPGWVRAPKQITDGHLSKLASAMGAVLATLDPSIPESHLIPR
jgi:hypothetical protein